MITYHTELVQGSQEWLDARCGLLTASEMKLIITPTLKMASNDKERSHLYELMAQRITKHVEPHYVSDDMLRGHEDEIYARERYAAEIAEVDDMGFITNDKWGFTLGYSPDGLVGFDGQIECKSRRQKFQMETIIECVIENREPADFTFQIQTGHLVSERKWTDFLSYHGGIHMVVIRVYPDEKVMNAIVEAAGAFEMRMAEKMARYNDIISSGKFRLFPTERVIEQEMV